MTDTSSRAIVLLTHFYDDAIDCLYRRVASEAPSGHDVYLLINCGDQAPSFPAAETAIPAGRLYLCNKAMMLALGYAEKCKPQGWTGNGWTLNPGNTDLLMISFAKAHPGYDYYWGIEYDVHYEGSWRDFLAYFASSDADLLGTTLYRQSETPGKPLMPPHVDSEGRAVAYEDTLRGFFPIFRVSSAAIEAIDMEYAAGWGGHYEMTWPTIAGNHGLKIEDIGGNGAFVAPQNVNRFYFNFRASWSFSPGTFVFRPAFSKTMRYKNTLWHPVKPIGHYHLWQALKFNDKIINNIIQDIKPIIWNIIIRVWFLIKWNKLP